MWNDLTFDITWTINDESILSVKDQQAKTLATAGQFGVAVPNASHSMRLLNFFALGSSKS